MPDEITHETRKYACWINADMHVSHWKENSKSLWNCVIIILLFCYPLSNGN